MLVKIKRDLVQGLLEYAKEEHPQEIIVLLRGERRRDHLYIHTVIIPPFSVGGIGFASFNPYMLPADASIVGSAHSHPSGVKKPSVQDLLHMYGHILVIIGYPYRDPKNDVAVFDKEGNRIEFDLE